jgi:hypothetical protein
MTEHVKPERPAPSGESDADRYVREHPRLQPDTDSGLGEGETELIFTAPPPDRDLRAILVSDREHVHDLSGGLHLAVTAATVVTLAPVVPVLLVVAAAAAPLAASVASARAVRSRLLATSPSPSARPCPSPRRSHPRLRRSHPRKPSCGIAMAAALESNVAPCGSVVTDTPLERDSVVRRSGADDDDGLARRTALVSRSVYRSS